MKKKHRDIPDCTTMCNFLYLLYEEEYLEVRLWEQSINEKLEQGCSLSQADIQTISQVQQLP